ncbi:hypothetical protein L873DRAFT_870281 [Choiromyces venosus 120613-1]|uniref:PiggyBac transposable element-derived protein 4 C-terminal zinc-ribbon domain-containing protein n=1 Tax=Choiromyces venosus 120613-1 TaxID=1336337 RepID=A0A3N4IWP4_9PEZI|nr:hypothetical protein L873DRAFT_870281 [Choiromyces venosus 120613-1]
MKLPLLRNLLGKHTLIRDEGRKQFHCFFYCYVKQGGNLSDSIREKLKGRDKKKDFISFLCSHCKVPLCKDYCFTLFHES